MVKIAPSILSAPPLALKEVLADLRAADLLHLDMMDGHFVPNLTFGPWLASAVVEAAKTPVEAHLMVSNPEAYLKALAAAGCRRVYVHQETAPHLHRILGMVRSLGMEAGVALNPATPVDLLTPVQMDVDALLIMSVDPGWGGQAFWPGAVEKVRRARALGFRGAVAVDGGIDPDTAPGVVQVGADHLVVGSYLFPGGGREETAQRLLALRRVVQAAWGGGT